jgi:hypothetical protein
LGTNKPEAIFKEGPDIFKTKEYRTSSGFFGGITIIFH